MNAPEDLSLADSTRETMRMCLARNDEAKRRLWAASDEVTQLKRDLSEARGRLSAADFRLSQAQHDFEEARDFVKEAWEFCRTELERAWGAGVPVSTPKEVADAARADRLPVR